MGTIVTLLSPATQDKCRSAVLAARPAVSVSMALQVQLRSCTWPVGEHAIGRTLPGKGRCLAQWLEV